MRRHVSNTDECRRYCGSLYVAGQSTVIRQDGNLVGYALGYTYNQCKPVASGLLLGIRQRV